MLAFLETLVVVGGVGSIVGGLVLFVWSVVEFIGAVGARD
jgi:hypothetical protein